MHNVLNIQRTIFTLRVDQIILSLKSLLETVTDWPWWLTERKQLFEFFYYILTQYICLCFGLQIHQLAGP